MAPTEVLRLIAWIAALFWGIWHANVQLERLHRASFEEIRSQVSHRIATSSGFFRIAGIVIYSPYVRPLKATLLWLSVLIALIVI
ncbi:MAG: hypothetical protein KA603_12965 [Azonexus sp.]|jgi:hypothetical protein|nr:hypothetical protein [Betaproteobacteria bacterium]MBK8917626.1 hypothetical protein [Betaproteobacteria bacterium]MBP6037034.1 hypothetical protein [Azonexus sp.]MBP6907499.1 hypothetical protein [Azonexus sp.]